MIWPWIILAILLFLLFYPLRIKGHFRYEKEQWQGKVTLLPFFGLKWPKVTLFDSDRTKKRGKETKNEKNQAKTKIEGKKNLFGQQQSLAEQIPIVLELLSGAKQGIKKLHVRFVFGYGFNDPAVMGYLTGAIYGILPLLFGDFRNTHWCIRVEPQWGLSETVAFARFNATVNLFSMIRSFGPLMPKVYDMIPKKTRRNERCRNIPSNP
ncbi:MAG: DUF2953 domain-containing protein [Bacillota bacterium]|nr:DUF2953 domain-containing protein [Bacillota bacterium]